MKKFWNTIAKDFWIIILDILAVNVAYFLSLIIRFYVNFQFRDVAKNGYLPIFFRFAPIYTALAILVFALFRLYGGMWRYAGVNDMNRIVLANLVTAAIQVIGTTVVFLPPAKHRMPFTYYLIGAVLQLLFIILIRFGYRILLVEKKKLSVKKSAAIPTLIIGAGETGRKAVNHLEESTAFRPVFIVDAQNAGKSMNGVPVTGDLDKALQNVQAIVIADPTLDAEARRQIQAEAKERNIELRDYTGYLSNLGGKVPLSSLLELTKGPVTVTADGQERRYESGEEALKEITGTYEVTAIREPKIELRKPTSVAYAGFEAWAKEHKEQTGEDVSFF